MSVFVPHPRLQAGHDLTLKLLLVALGDASIPTVTRPVQLNVGEIAALLAAGLVARDFKVGLDYLTAPSAGSTFEHWPALAPGGVDLAPRDAVLAELDLHGGGRTNFGVL